MPNTATHTAMNVIDILDSDLIIYLKSKKKNINTKQIEAFKKLRIVTVSDLLYFAPSRYIDFSFEPNSDTNTISSKENISNNKDKISIYGYINKIEGKKAWKSKIPMTEASIECPSETLTALNIKKIKVLWFNQIYMSKMYNNGDKVLISGKYSITSSVLTFSNPYIEKIKSFPETQNSLFNQRQDLIQEKIIPIYSETANISSKYIFECVKKVLSDIAQLDNDNKQQNIKNTYETLPEQVLKELNLPPLSKTFLLLHTPRNQKDYKTAQKRLLFEEIFYLQLNIQKERLNSHLSTAYKISISKDELQNFFNRENITPTQAQSKVIKEILSDLNKNRPMQRLLEGDVGSGKTFVAAAATLATITNNDNKNKIGRPLQVAYLAPTEILAKQQFESFIKYFKHTKVSIGYLSGKESFKFPSKLNKDLYTKISKPQLIKWIQSGEISVLIGTHSIVRKSVIFKDLALTIIDEQHRFGVDVRGQLAHKKNDNRAEIPHLLSMTATPIPRTLALSIFGDLDLSIIDQLPQGRQKTNTTLISNGDEKQVFEKIKLNINQGRQVFVICTKINSDENNSKNLNIFEDTEIVNNRKSVESETLRLQKIFAQYKVCGLHGKTDKIERERIMNDFKDNKINILVSTSIIEVGVNIPNANIIIIQDAERFGLSQLHQMRGRVGRGNYQAECILYTSSKNPDSLKRLNIFTKINDGFALAEEDLNTRGAGGILTGRQSGLSDMAMEAIKNIKLVETAKKYAKDIIDKDPYLENHQILINKLEKIKTLHLE